MNRSVSNLAKLLNAVLYILPEPICTVIHICIYILVAIH